MKTLSDFGTLWLNIVLIVLITAAAMFYVTVTHGLKPEKKMPLCEDMEER